VDGGFFERMNACRRGILFNNLQLFMKALNFATNATHEAALEARMLEGSTFTKNMFGFAECAKTSITLVVLASVQLVDHGVNNGVLSRIRK
jgi:hypothetical protein